MESRGAAPSSLPAEPQYRGSEAPSEAPACGDEELDEETMKHISALYTALGPLMPEVTKLQSHQDPPAHLMVDMKAKLQEVGSSVSDARKRMLRYNIYLKKKLARAVERKAWQEQLLLRQQHLGNQQPSAAPLPRGGRPEGEPGKASLGAEKNIQEIMAAEIQRLKPLERAQRRVRLPEAHLAPEDAARTSVTPQGFLQKTAFKVDNMASCPSLERSPF